MTDFERIAQKLDAINAKLDNHLERIAKVENSEGWIRITLGLIVSALGTVVYRLFIEK